MGAWYVENTNEKDSHTYQKYLLYIDISLYMKWLPTVLIPLLASPPPDIDRKSVTCDIIS